MGCSLVVEYRKCWACCNCLAFRNEKFAPVSNIIFIRLLVTLVRMERRDGVGGCWDLEQESILCRVIHPWCKCALLLVFPLCPIGQAIAISTSSSSCVPVQCDRWPLSIILSDMHPWLWVTALSLRTTIKGSAHRDRAVTHNHGCISERVIHNDQQSHRTGTHDA